MTLNRWPPPPKRFFESLSPRGEAPPLGVDIGGWVNRFHGLDTMLLESLRTRYGIFIVPADAKELYRIRALDGLQEHFVPPDGPVRPRVHPLSLGWEGDLLSLRSYGFVGWASLGECRGEIALARGDYERPEWCVENYLRVVTAWRAVREGGALIHAASLVRNGAAYIFLGASGSGKSTLCAISREGEVVSDDLTLVRRLPEGFRVAGSPFRGTYEGGEAVRGFFPIGGIFRIFQSTENRLESCPRANAVPDLLAGSPFVLDQLAHESGILSNLGALAAAHPVSYLHFNLDGRFWDLIPKA